MNDTSTLTGVWFVTSYPCLSNAKSKRDGGRSDPPQRDQP